MEKLTITDAQRRQIIDFARENGRPWKKVLLFDFWMKGKPVPGYPDLYGLRNTHGPSWLDKLNVKKLEADAPPWEPTA